ncbi:MAG: RRXRR domain-containing protein [Limnochordia bacterium]
MNKVLVLDTEKKPLAPTHPAKARQLLKNGKAAVYRRDPFTIILKRVVENPCIPPPDARTDPSDPVPETIVDDT